MACRFCTRRWDEKIGTPGGVECDNPDPDWVQCGTPRHNVTFEYANGKKRFSSWSVEEKRQLTGWSLIGAILLIMLADIYSEKLWICCIMNFIACGASIFGLIMWISFTDDLGLDTDDRLVLGSVCPFSLGTCFRRVGFSVLIEPVSSCPSSCTCVHGAFPAENTACIAPRESSCLCGVCPSTCL